MGDPKLDEWAIVESLLPAGWREKAVELGAFDRVREFEEPGQLLRLLLFYAINDTGARTTAALAEAAGITRISGEALLKRLCSSEKWLSWIAGEMTNSFRSGLAPTPSGYRLRVVDSTTAQTGGSTTSVHRLHYSVDLSSLGCDWHELTDAREAELLERTPVTAGDVLLADRNYLRYDGVKSVKNRGGDVLVRAQTKRSAFLDERGRRVDVLDLARRVRVGSVGEWRVSLTNSTGDKPIPGRLIVLRLAKPIAEQNRQRIIRKASRKQKKVGQQALAAAEFVILFTTLAELSAKTISDLYRARWQIELVFKRLKQLLELGHIPHRRRDRARAWILAKLIVSLVLERMHRNAMHFSPWGYSLDAVASKPPASAV